MNLKGKTILLGITGGIAAYKSAYLASKLVKEGTDVHVIMTENAKNFINPITFETLTGNRCISDTFDREFTFEVEHIALAKKADIVMVAPATANTIAKFAHGIADNMLTTTILACTCPIIVAPAMNTAMYENALTQENIAKLKKVGMEVITPASGRLACRDVGPGKMPEPEDLAEYIYLAIALPHDLEGKNVLVTAGATQESMDPVRYITNHSTGKMGYNLAKICAYRGANVTLVSGETSLKTPANVELVEVKSCQDMFEGVMAHFDNADIVIKAAAVADYTPKETATHKIKKHDDDLTIELARTTDILGYLGEHKKTGQFLCGFSMETDNLIENSKAKLKKKNLDMIVANSLNELGAGFGLDTNCVTMITPNSDKKLPLMSKEEVSVAIVDEILKNIG